MKTGFLSSLPRATAALTLASVLALPLAAAAAEDELILAFIPQENPEKLIGDVDAITTWLADEIGERLITTGVSGGEIDTMVIDGLTIFALGIMHTGCEAGRDSPCIDHVAWLVETDGCRILHLGDAKVAAGKFEQFPWLSGLEIDVAFVPFWFLQQAGGAELITELIAPKAVVLMHWNRWNRDSVVEELELYREALPPTVMFSEAFEKISF